MALGMLVSGKAWLRGCLAPGMLGFVAVPLGLYCWVLGLISKSPLQGWRAIVGYFAAPSGGYDCRDTAWQESSIKKMLVVTTLCCQAAKPYY